MTEVSHPVPEAPVRNGVPLWGLYDEPFQRMNLDESRGHGWFANLPRLVRRFRLKEWQHIAVVHPEIYLSFAIVDAKMAAKSFAVIYDRRTRSTTNYDRLGTPLQISLPGTLWDGVASFRSGGWNIEIRNELIQERHQVRLSIPGGRGLPPLEAELTLRESMTENRPLVAVLPLPGWMPVYTHKVPAPVEGVIRVGGQEYRCNAEECVGLLDVHKAFYPPHTTWKWATFHGKDIAGRPVGVNLTQNVILHDEQYNENVLWLPGRLEGLSAVRYEIPEDVRQTWLIRSTDGRVELEFHPEGIRQNRTNIGPIRSSYEQPFGTFKGRLRAADGTLHEVRDIFGVAERHEVWW